MRLQQISAKSTRSEGIMQKRKWLKAVCPICNQEYEYLSGYKPATCGKFDCLYAFHHREALDRKQRINGERNG